MVETNELLKNVLVYGVGCIGKGVLSRLMYLKANIVGIAVTNCSENDEAYHGLQIKNIEHWKEYTDSVVLIATSYSFHKEIKENCIKHGFTNIVEATPELLEELSILCYKKLFLKHNISMQEKAFSIGNGQYMNPFITNIPNVGGFFGQLGDFVIPMIYKDYDMVNEGTYELGNVELKSGDIVLDLGANLGTFSVYAVSKGCTPYAFEPTPDLHPFIKQHSGLNGDKINIIPYAVSNKCGQATFYLDSFTSGGNSLLNHGDGDDEQVSTLTVRQISVDEFVKQNKLERVDFIKADIEGAERLMLEGAVNTLKEFAPKLALCTYHLPDDKEVLTELILKANPDYKIEYKWEKLFAHI